jgi:predicted alpha/beta hydrolase family esterase
MIKNLLLIKGYGEKHQDRWQAHEADYATSKSIQVFYPQDIPNFIDGTPSIQAFREYILHIIETDGLEPDRTAVLAHSLGGNGWLHILNTREDFQAQFLTTLIGTPQNNHTGLNQINNFFPTPKLNPNAGNQILVVGSDNDQIINETPATLGAHLNSSFLTIPRAGHFMPHALHQNPNEMDLGKQWLEIRERIARLNLPY